MPAPVASRRRLTCSCRVVDGAENGRCGGDQRRFPYALCPERPERVWILDQIRLDRRHIADGRDQVIVEVLRAPRHELLHQSEAQPLGDAAMDLTLRQRRVDDATCVMRGDDGQHLAGAERGVYLHLGDLGRKAVSSVGYTLTIRVQGRRWRVPG